MNCRWSTVRFRWIIVTSLLLSACSAASDVTPAALPLTDDTTTSVDSDPSVEPDTDEPESATETTSPLLEFTLEGGATTSEVVDQPSSTSSTSTAVAPTTVAPSSDETTTTTPLVDPNAAFCQAAIEIDELGTFTELDDTEAATIFFNAQADRWATAADAAPPAIAADARTVATFNSEMRTLLAANDFDLFAVFEELTELEASSGSDAARIRVDQFIFANCDVTPPLAEQATAAFYGGLLDSADDRTYLAELLASAEVFPLDGAQCFADRATPEVMHPLVGAPSTVAQDAALSSVLGACQLSIGT